MFLTFSEVNGVSSIVKLFLTFLKVLSVQGGVQLSAKQKAAAKVAESRSTHNRKSNTNNKSRQVAQTIKSTKQQQHRENTPKGSAKTAKEAARAAQTTAAKAAHPRGTKQQQKSSTKAQRAGPQRSLCALTGVF